MSAIARLMLSSGKTVSGSDSSENAYTKQLNEIGAKISIGHKKENITKDIDLVIYSLSIKEDNIEFSTAKAMGIKCIKRGIALGIIAKEYQNVIAISGMHGKTTTTAMVYRIFKNCGYNPTLHIGGDIDEQNKNLVIGDRDFFITEACEYGDSFLGLNPTVSVINNIEKEHLDYFGTIGNIYKSFNRFMLQSKVCFVNSSLKQKIITIPNLYVGKGGKIYAKNVKSQNGKYIFDVYIGEELYGKIKLSVAGKYNIHNTLSAIAVANYYTLDKEKVIKAINTFSNVKMRFEYVGKYQNKYVIFDYAHHPTEIKNAIQTAKIIGKEKVFVFFQPHTFSRTKSLKKEFSKAFNLADSVFVCTTYKARESLDTDNNEQALAQIIAQNTSRKVLYGDIDDILACIKNIKESGILLFLGAGDMQNKIKNKLFEAKKG